MDMKSVVISCKGDLSLFHLHQATLMRVMKGDLQTHAFKTLTSTEVFNFVQNPIQHMTVKDKLVTAWTKTHIIEIDYN